MTAKVILTGVDELMLGTGLTLPEAYTHSHLRSELVSRFGQGEVRPIYSDSNLGLGSWRIPIPEGEIRVHPQGNRRYVVHAFLDARKLHADPAEAYAAACRALDLVRGTFTPADRVEPIRLKSIALHADILGWNYTPATEQRLLHPGGAVPHGHTRDAEFTGTTFGKSFSVYDKTVEIAVDPSGDWIEEFWPDEAVHPSAGHVWRVEARATSMQDLRRVVESVSVFWLHMLQRYLLVRSPGPGAPKNRRAWLVDPVWRLLREAQFPTPWEVAPALPTRRKAPREHTRAALLGRLLRHVANVAGIDGIDGDFPAAAAQIVREAIAKRPFLEGDMQAWAARWKA